MVIVRVILKTLTNIFRHEDCALDNVESNYIFITLLRLSLTILEYYNCVNVKR